jgi:ectoine hydroxylase-related dioxygenase (phytanoyl-CoA dioxygenase family)
VFVPLSDLRLANGPTEFIPESHRFYDIDRKPVQFELNAGQVLLFDYRVKHRGVENRSDRPRPMLYFTVFFFSNY